MKELSEILQELIDSSDSDRIDAIIFIAEAYEAGMNKASKLINPSEEDNDNY